MIRHIMTLGLRLGLAVGYLTKRDPAPPPWVPTGSPLAMDFEIDRYWSD